MNYKGTVLLLDNFRSKLKGFTIDVQDVVRSAILDGVDLEPYLEACKGNPYKLDQIRLSIKENQTFDVNNLSGEMIYQIREYLRGKSFDVIEFNKQMKNNLSNEHISYLLKWLGSGISLKGLDVSIIPKSLLEIFDVGLSSGVNMKKYNTGVIYNVEVLSLLIKIEQNRKPVDKFLKGEWKKSVIHTFAMHSGYCIGGYESVYNSVSCEDSYDRVDGLLGLATSSISLSLDIDKLQAKNDKGEYLYEDACMLELQRALSLKISLEKVLSVYTAAEMKTIIEEAKLDSTRTISGKFTKTSRTIRREGIPK